MKSILDLLHAKEAELKAAELTLAAIRAQLAALCTVVPLLLEPTDPKIELPKPGGVPFV